MRIYHAELILEDEAQVPDEEGYLAGENFAMDVSAASLPDALSIATDAAMNKSRRNDGKVVSGCDIELYRDCPEDQPRGLVGEIEITTVSIYIPTQGGDGHNFAHQFEHAMKLKPANRWSESGKSGV